MLFNLFILILGSIFGLILSFELIFVNKYLEYFEKKNNDKNFLFKALSVLIRLLLPITFCLFLILTIDLSCFYNLNKNVISLCFISLISGFIIFTFIFIKLGKIKIKHNVTKESGLKKSIQKQKFKIWWIRLASIGAFSIVIIELYIYKNHVDIFQRHRFLPWMLTSIIFIIAAIILWVLRKKNSK